MIYFVKNHCGCWAENESEAGLAWKQTKWEVIAIIQVASGGGLDHGGGRGDGQRWVDFRHFGSSIGLICDRLNVGGSE